MAAFRLSVTALPPLLHVPARRLKAVHFCDFGSVREMLSSHRTVCCGISVYEPPSVCFPSFIYGA